MPVARYKTTIAASFEDVEALLDDKVDRPRKYIDAVQHSTILERHPDYVIREMFQPRPVPMTIREKIYRVTVDGGIDHVFERLEGDNYTGAFHNILTRVEGRDDQVQLEYFMDWHPAAGTEDPMPREVAERLLSDGVEQLKSAAENPVPVPEWVRVFFDAADSLDAEALRPLLHRECRFRVGNNVDTVGIDDVVEASGHLTTVFSAMRHHYVRVDDLGDRAYVECLVSYTTVGGSEFLIPFLTRLDRDGDKITAVLAYGDMSPVVHGW